MESEIIKVESDSITIQVTIPLSDDMLSTEEAIQQGVNHAGLLATQHALSRFDTDGTPIEVSTQKPTSVLLANLNCVVMSIRAMKGAARTVRWITMPVSLSIPLPSFPRWSAKSILILVHVKFKETFRKIMVVTYLTHTFRI